MKRNKADIGQILLIVGGIIVAMLIIFWVLRATGVIKRSGNDTVEQAAQLFAGYSDAAVANYDGNTVSGDDVIDCLDKYTAAAGVTVTVKTKADSTGTSYSSASKYIAPSATDNKYINPKGVFEGKVKMNSNNIVTEIIFTQQ